MANKQIIIYVIYLVTHKKRITAQYSVSMMILRGRKVFLIMVLYFKSKGLFQFLYITGTQKKNSGLVCDSKHIHL